MILDFKTMDLYPENHLRVLFEKFPDPAHGIVQEYVRETGDKTLSPSSAVNLVRKLREVKPHGNDMGKNTNKSGKNNNRKGMRIKTNITLTKVAVWYQQKKNWKIMGGRRTVMDPRYIKDIFEERNLDHNDFLDDFDEKDEWTRQKYSRAIRQMAAPQLEELVVLTEYIREFDRGTIKIPKNPGKRWDIDDWSEYDIDIKDSWEEERD